MSGVHGLTIAAWVTLSPQWLDELRARTLLSAVIAPSVKIIKAGREFKACCPFHNEKTPSFTINDEKGFYHCFGCGAHGDAIRFLTDARGLPFMDAVKELAGKAGMEVPAQDPRMREKAERSAGLWISKGRMSVFDPLRTFKPRTLKRDLPPCAKGGGCAGALLAQPI